MNLKRIIPLILSLSLFFTSCSLSGEDELELEVQTFKTVAELTRDDQKEGIVTKIAENKKDPSSVTIYYKIEDKWYPMYGIELSTKKSEQCGLYVCKKSGDTCLLLWKPTYDGDETVLAYQVFYLKYDIASEKGHPIIVEEDSISFTSGQVAKDGDKYTEAHEFLSKLNRYLSKSAALADTIGGEMVYSASSKAKTYKLYEPEWYDTGYKSSASNGTASINRVESSESSSEEAESDGIDDADRFKTEDVTSINEQ